MELGAALPQKRRLLALAFGEQCQLAAHPLLLGAREIGCCSFISRFRRGSMVRLRYLRVKRIGCRAFFMRVAEDAQPVESGLSMNSSKTSKSRSDSPGNPTMKLSAQRNSRHGGAHFRERLQKDLCTRTAFHALQYIG